MTKTFRDLGVDAALCDALEAQGIIHPFPIQELTLPLALGRNDLIAQARTGTGKTLGFGLPLLQQIDPDLAATQALVIVPTRELCVQVHSDLTIGEKRGLTTISVYGGVGFDEQIAALQSGVHVVVGTPGRLLDHLKRGNLDLSNVKVLVLDEADEMLDMGFLPDVERLIEACPAEGRHTMLFSATMPTVIVKMARRYLHHPTFTRADTEEHETAPNVAQHFFSVHRMDKPRVLARILQSPGRGGCYVFVRTKHMADRLVNDLEELQIPAIAIHGDLRQQTREKNLDRFRSGQANVLVATEVAARGIDVTGVTHVVNYDCPDDQKMYLHRIGRTARAGNEGVAVTFAEFNEADRLNVIRKAVGATDTEVHQVFSTSPLLAELFDLPDEKPWDHLSKKSSGGGRGDDRRPAPRKGNSDGRPKSKRGSEGTGRDRDASRGRSRRDEPRRDEAPRDEAPRDEAPRDEAPRDEAPRDAQRRDEARRDASRDDRPRADERDADTSSPASSPARRERTRTRTRDRGSAGGSSRDRGRSEADTSDTSSSTASEPTSSDDSAPSPSTGRTRARSGARARSAQQDPKGADRGATRDRSSQRDRTNGDRAKGDRAEGSRSDRSRSEGSRSEGGRSESNRSEGGRSESGRGGRSGGGRSGGSSRGKSGGGRSGGQRSSRDDRSERPSSDEVPGVQHARRGADARGEGEPQLARRVKVEHLP
ncbi:DEAD/DEAH box helicase [Egicoccus sp. AB-alg6-2]|uniref:DEAD/DEAH box helicase n=1 Tax=Egicoccus sp. AB-alg6-2 TaxID=3242692 RepID=UPI00359E235E